MTCVRRAAVVVLAVLAAAEATHAQSAGARPVSADARVITQSIQVPVFPGQMVTATIALPALEETPLPAVLILAVREPGSAPVAAALAMADALLARGFAVVQLDLPPLATAPVGEPLVQPADDAYAVLQFVREREDIDGDRVALVGVGEAAEHAARAAALDEGTRALVLLGARPMRSDTMGLPTGLPLLSLPLETRAAPLPSQPAASPVSDAAAFLTRHLQ
jgi:hypothetical protein